MASELAHLPRIHDISIDPTVLAFTLGVSLAAGLPFGLISVFKYARPSLSTGLSDWREVIGVVADLRDSGVDQRETAIAASVDPVQALRAD